MHFKPALGGLGGDRGAVVAAGGRDHAFVAFLGRFVGADRSPAGFEAAGGVGGFVFDQDRAPLPGSEMRADHLGELAQLEQRRVADLGLALDADDVGVAVAGLGHHALVIEGDRAVDEIVEIHAQRGLHDFIFAGHHSRVGNVAAAHSSHSVPIVSSSGTTSPKLCV